MKKIIGIFAIFVIFCLMLCSCSSNREEKSGVVSSETTVMEQTAYQEWMDALSSENKGEKYENIVLNLNDVEELYRDGLIGTDDFKKALFFMSGQSTGEMSSMEMISVYEDVMPKMKRYFTAGQEGAIRFLEDIEAIGNGWAVMDKATGEWALDFQTEDVANYMNLGEEVIECILGRLCDYGFNINED